MPARSGALPLLRALCVPTFAETMVTKLETLLLANAGAESVSLDGQAVTFADLERKYDYWKSRVALEQGTKPRVASINLGGF